MGKNLQKIYLTYYDLLIAQDLIHKIKCKFVHNDKKCKTFGIKV